MRLSNVRVAAKYANDDDFEVTPSATERCATVPNPNCARVSDFFLAAGNGNDGIPATMLGQTFTSVTGVMDDFQNRNPVSLRTLGDLAP